MCVVATRSYLAILPQIAEQIPALEPDGTIESEAEIL